MIDRKLNYGRHIIENFAKLIDKFEVVLDIGAGSGEDLKIFKKYNNKCKAIALEICDEYIENLISYGFEVYKINIERESIPIDNESVDVIIANQILEHIKEIFWIFHEMTRVLKVGGYLVLGVPNLASLHNRILLCLGKQPTCIKNSSAHVRGFTKDDILNFLKIWDGGYELIDFKGSNFYPFPPLLQN